MEVMVKETFSINQLKGNDISNTKKQEISFPLPFFKITLLFDGDKTYQVWIADETTSKKVCQTESDWIAESEANEILENALVAYNYLNRKN